MKDPLPNSMAQHHGGRTAGAIFRVVELAPMSQRNPQHAEIAYAYPLLLYVDGAVAGAEVRPTRASNCGHQNVSGVFQGFPGIPILTGRRLKLAPAPHLPHDFEESIRFRIGQG